MSATEFSVITRSLHHPFAPAPPAGERVEQVRRARAPRAAARVPPKQLDPQTAELVRRHKEALADERLALKELGKVLPADVVAQVGAWAARPSGVIRIRSAACGERVHYACMACVRVYIYICRTHAARHAAPTLDWNQTHSV